MSYLYPGKLIYHPDRLIDRRPVTADIFLTNFCNQECEYCRYKHGTGHMAPVIFERVITVLKAAGIKAINLTGGGEPLLHPEIGQITEILHQAELPYGINTNLTKLPPENARPVWIKVSLDAASGKEYERTRGRDQYGLVLNNIARAKKIFKDTTIGAQCMINDGPEQIENFYLAHRDRGLDYLHYAPVEARHRYYKPELHYAILKEIEAAGQESALNTTQPEKWQFDYDAGGLPCDAYWAVATIDHQGQLLYCCHKPEEKIGPISPEALKRRHTWQTDPATCETPCRLYYYNQFLRTLARTRTSHSEFL
jgi:MoaA/NifB/PqqE/SkfB family radical SAM enzyme